MSLITRANGSTSTNQIQASWFNDFNNLLTGVMQDQEVDIKNNVLAVGIGADPASAPTGAIATGTALGIGNYTYKITFVVPAGESNFGPVSSTITTTTGNQAISLTAIPTGATGTTGRKIYRTKVGGSFYYLVTTIADNTTTTYTDTTADSSLVTLHQGYSSFGGTFQTKSNSGVIRSILSQDGVLVLNPNGVVLNGSTSGTATLYQFNRGLYKSVWVMFSNFKNNGGSAQSIALPTPFTQGEHWYAGGIGAVQFLLNGSAQTVGVVTALASGGGTVTLTTTMNAYSFGDNFSGFDTISFPNSALGPYSGLFTVDGI